MGFCVVTRRNRQEIPMEKLPNVAASRQSLTANSQNLNDRKANATRCAKILLGCYRMADASDPETWVTCAVAVLCAYPQEVRERVANPLTGLPGRLKWLPAISEIREACDEIYLPMCRAMERAQRVEKQLLERETIEADRANRPTYDDLRAKYDGPNGEPWGLENAYRTIVTDAGKAR